MLWVRRVAADVEPLLETALEGIAWAVLTASDLPRAEPQRVIAGRSGKRYRVDFLIAGRVILEADGAVKYGAITPWQEKQRQSDLEAAGYWVVRCTWEELINRPHEVLARIEVALARSLPA
jgi:very-short-patch-repair endonuclease